MKGFPGFAPVIVLASAIALAIPAPVATQLRGEALYEHLGSADLVRSEGRMSVQWIPGGGGWWERESQGGEVAFWRIDPANDRRTPLFDARQTAALQEGVAAAGSSGSGLPFQEFEWVDGGQAIRFEVEGRWFHFNRASRELRELRRPGIELSVEVEGLMRNLAASQLARGVFSPDHDRWARIRDYDLWVTDTRTGEERQLTRGGSEEIMNGRTDWLYPEELGQSDAFWWSPDGRRIAYLQFNQADVALFPLVHDVAVLPRLEQQRYPKAGETNPTVNLFVVDVESGATVQVRTNSSPDVYILRGEWTPDGRELTFQRLNRRQDVLELLAADPTTGEVRTILREEESTFVNLHRDLTFLADGRRFLWSSERSGWKHLYLYDLEGTLLRPLTSGEYQVASIAGLDERNGWVYYTAHHQNALETHLHRVRLDGTRMARLTEQPGVHRPSVDPEGRYFVTNWSNLQTPPTTELRRADGRSVRTLGSSDVSALLALGLEPPELVTVVAADGVTPLNGFLYKPAGYDSTVAYPLLVSVYGGPSGPRVTNAWNMAATEQRWAQLGYMVWRVDNRGTRNRGKAFLDETYLKLGQVDLDDQAAAVRQVRERSYVDGNRVGIFGSSYGGYMSALALLKEPDVFQVGVAGASVTDWRNYDSAYTERFMRTPQENPEGYDAGSTLPFAANLRGKLLLVHGMTDNNVHPSNTMQLIDALVTAGKTFDLMVYPNQRHGIGGASGAHLNALRLDYFKRHLSPQPVAGPRAASDDGGE